jgi:hypothetical protein
MVRVLKPVGRPALVDFMFTGACFRVLQEIGISDAKRARVESFFAFWFSAVFNFGLVQTCQERAANRLLPPPEALWQVTEDAWKNQALHLLAAAGSL